MRRMLCCVAFLLFASALPAADANRLTPEEIADGWLLLFDGETLFGWKAESDANWSVQDGAIQVSEGAPGLLRTTAQFDNYVLKVDFKAAETTNSGVFLRTSPVVVRDDVKTKAYELNIAPPDNPFPTGGFVARAKAKEVKPSDEWRTFEVTLDGPQATVKLDGETVLEYTDEKKLGRGYIGLQLNSGPVQFRNVKLKPLGLKSLFNGKDLTGWKPHPSSKSQFTVADDGTLHVENGKGCLETADKFADFTLQLECRTQAQQLNSGVFFRCIPGEEMNGYESQIHNGFKDGDRTQPVDCGTGGIFRRVNARKVVADDEAWFSKTIVASGPHVAVWVNGYQVTDWADERKPHANPRSGLRLEAGTIQLQGHDPTTNLSFRNFRGGEITKRGL